MKFTELIDRYIEKGLKAYVNGMPEEEAIIDGERAGGGRIIKREEDYIIFEITNIAEKQQDTTKERLIIPINNILTLSQGAKKAGTLSGNLQEKTA